MHIDRADLPALRREIGDREVEIRVESQGVRLRRGLSVRKELGHDYGCGGHDFEDLVYERVHAEVRGGDFEVLRHVVRWFPVSLSLFSFRPLPSLL